MRKLILRMSMSLDGFVGRPKGERGTADNGAEEWIFRHMDKESTACGLAQIWGVGVHAMGRTTYGDMAAHWPTSTEVWAPPMNEIPKVVFSKTLKEAPWGPARILSGDLSEEVARLKAEPGKDILVHGGAGLAQSLTHRRKGLPRRQHRKDLSPVRASSEVIPAAPPADSSVEENAQAVSICPRLVRRESRRP